MEASRRPRAVTDVGPADSELALTMPRDHPSEEAQWLADSASACFDESQRQVHQIGFGATFTPDSDVRISGEPLGFDLSVADDETIGSFLPERPVTGWRDVIAACGWVETIGFARHQGLGRRIAEPTERVFGLPTTVEVAVAREGASRSLDADGPQIVAQVTGSSTLEVDGKASVLYPGMAASLRAGAPAQLDTVSPWGTVILARGRPTGSDGETIANITAAIDGWQASVDLRREPIASFEPARRARWGTAPAPPSTRTDRPDPLMVRCCAPGGVVLCEVTDTSLLVAIAGRLVSVSRRRVYPLAVVLAGEPVSFADLIRLFGGDRSLAAELVDVGGTHGWLEATWVPASP